MLATDTARILAADTTDLPKTATITELLGAWTQTDNSQASRTDAGTAKGSSAGVIVEEFQYELLGCKGIGGTVECSLRITNRGSDRTLYHTCGSGSQNSTRVMAYDNLGNVSSKAAAPLRIERVRTLFMLRLSRAFPPARPSRFQI